MYPWDLKQVYKISLIIFSWLPVDWILTGCNRGTLNRLTKLASLLVRGHHVTRNVQEVLVGPYTGQNEPHYTFKVTNGLEIYRMDTGTFKRRTKWASILVRSHQWVWNLKDVYVGLKLENSLWAIHVKLRQERKWRKGPSEAIFTPTNVTVPETSAELIKVAWSYAAFCYQAQFTDLQACAYKYWNFMITSCLLEYSSFTNLSSQLCAWLSCLHTDRSWRNV